MSIIDAEPIETHGTTTPSPNKRNGLEAIAQELRSLVKANARGELSALRRIDPDHPSKGALFRILARADLAEMGIDSLKRWAAATHIMAQRPDVLKPGDLGKSLAAIRISSSRIDMLLNARGDTLRDLVRRTARRLARSEEALPYRELCQLVLMDGQPDKDNAADELRIKIAQSYQRATRKS